MRWSLAVLLMLGCGTSTPVGPVVPVALVLQPTPVAVGAQVRFQVDADPDARVLVALSLADDAGLWCPAELAGCLDIPPPRLSGSSATSASGTAEVEVSVPEWVDLGTVLAQAFVVSPRGRSEPVRIEVLDPEGDEDGDTLTNVLELSLGADPFSRDTDGDGLDDPDEFARGSSLTNPDTDGDGLLDGEEVDLGLDPQSTDSDLDGLDDATEQALGTSPADDDTDDDGLVDGDEVGVHGTSPLLFDTDGDGLGDGEEQALGTAPLLADSDGDTLDDGLEVRLLSSPLVVDTDGDGLTDAAEVAAGTAPWADDTDGGGRDDGEEVARGDDPLDSSDDVPVSCDVGKVRDCVDRCQVAPEADGTCDLAFDCETPTVIDPDCPTSPRTSSGVFEIASDADLQGLAGVARHEGILRIVGDGPADIVLPRLEHLDALELPSGAPLLREVAPLLREVVLPSLTTAGSLEVHDAPRLRHVVVASLRQLGRLDVASVGQLRTLHLPRVRAVDEVRLAELGQLHRVGLDDLVDVGTLSLEQTPRVASVWLPSLETADVATLSSLGPDLVLPELEHADVLAVEADAERVLFPALSTIGQTCRPSARPPGSWRPTPASST
jgi:hypothetical protein